MNNALTFALVLCTAWCAPLSAQSKSLADGQIRVLPDQTSESELHCALKTPSTGRKYSTLRLSYRGETHEIYASNAFIQQKADGVYFRDDFVLQGTNLDQVIQVIENCE